MAILLVPLVSPSPSYASGTYPETTGYSSNPGGVINTWTNYTNAGGSAGPTINPYTTVQISCRLNGFRVPDGNTWWYQIASAPWNYAYYASADAFYNNGATSGSLKNTPFFDPAVPVCGSGSGLPETTGGSANTWTNYNNAGGVQGPTIGSRATVTIGCRLSGFRVADGNTWWYQIASAPWNGNFYVSADAFYNNGATSGSLAGTPFVDPAVPVCGGGSGGGGGTSGTPEQEGHYGVHTFANYQNASGQGPSIGALNTVLVACKIYAPTIASVNPDGYWYQIASSPWNGLYYAPANTFFNGDPVNGPYSHNTDFSVPDCGNAPRPQTPIVSLGQGPTAPAGYRYAISLSGFPANASVSLNCFDSVSSRGFYPFTLTTDGSGSASTAGACYSADGPDHWVVANGVYPSNHVTWGSGSGSATAHVTSARAGNQGATPPRSQKSTSCSTTRPVNCASGDFWHAFPDFSIPGRGVPLQFSHTYTSSAAATDGPLGFGWTDPYHMSLTTNGSTVTVTEEDGAQVSYTANADGTYSAPSWVLATLVANPDGTYTFTRDASQIRYVFSSYGQLAKEIDRNGYVTSLSYTGNQLTSITDPAGRSLTLAYSGSQISSLSDPLGRTAKFAYNAAGDLTSVTNPAGGTWTFTYDASHLLLTMTDPNGGVTTNTYDSSDRVVKQTDPAGRLTTWGYNGDNSSATGGTTTMTDANGNKTTYGYQNLELQSVTHAAGTSLASTTSYTYDPNTLGIATQTDPNGHTTSYTYDSHGNVLTKTDPLGRATTTTYNSFNEPTAATDPLGVTTTSTYDANGNLLSTSRPLSGTSSSQVTRNSYGDSGHPGDVTARTDPNGKITTFGYDASGDAVRTADPNGHITTASYNADGEKLNSVSPNGNLTGATPSSFTTTYTYDPLGDLLTTTDPLGHVTTTTWDPDQNKISTTDPLGHRTTYSYNPDNERTATYQPDGTTLLSTYDGNGNVLTKTDGAGHTTSYAYNGLNQQVSAKDPLGRTTTYSYDGAGNQLTGRDPNGHTTTSSYDADNELTAALQRRHHAIRQLQLRRGWTANPDDRRHRRHQLPLRQPRPSNRFN